MKSKEEHSMNSSKLDEQKSCAGYFKKYSLEGSPFDVKVEEEREEDVFETNGVRHVILLLLGVET